MVDEQGLLRVPESESVTTRGGKEQKSGSVTGDAIVQFTGEYLPPPSFVVVIRTLCD